MGKNKYDWSEIQKYCGDRVVSSMEIQKMFGASISTITCAVRRGQLVINRSDNGSNARYDWTKIQKDIDSELTFKEISLKYGVSNASIDKARKRGEIITKNKSEAMKISCKKHPRKHSEETKKKISNIRKQYIVDHPDEAPYLLNHYSHGESYPEKYFADVFEKEKIKLDRYYRIGTYQLDFADVNKKIDIEVDGSQHRYDPRIVTHDIKRNNFMSSIGWRVFRVYWPEYQKKNLEEREKVVLEIKNLVAGV